MREICTMLQSLILFRGLDQQEGRLMTVFKKQENNEVVLKIFMVKARFKISEKLVMVLMLSI